MAWLKTTPREFRFAVKGPTYITHIKRLKDAGGSLGAMAGSMKILKPKIACFLWQLPSGFKKTTRDWRIFVPCSSGPNRSRNSGTCSNLPTPAGSATTFTGSSRITAVVCALRIRRKPGEWAVTTDFIYLRFNGGKAFYNSNYSRNELEQLADKVRAFPRPGQNGLRVFSATTNRGSRCTTRRRSVCCFWSGGCSDDFLARGASCC